ncbi:uncharacterized protein LOC132796090 [Drosophila nasuta]|uniref:uncharacterized protein LOC132796090 n=1 Tax=Drosophila nasuta TaxID=42062 RepID=UPI00295EC7FB|nr:uncharacterized protein LOC132796090 [Drosophila nasuta]
MSIMAGSMDYKWRKRMCYKWQEEMRLKQLMPAPATVPIVSQQQLQRQREKDLQHYGDNQKYTKQTQQQQYEQQQRKLHEQQRKLHQQKQQQQQRTDFQRQQQQQQESQQSLISNNKSLDHFIEDPMNLHKLFLPRCTLQKLSYRADFQRLVKMCFVRVKFGIGHRVAQIQGFGKWRPASDPTLILRLDNNPRVFTMDQLANTYFVAAELRDFEYMWRAYNFELPSRRIIEQKYKALTDAKLLIGKSRVANVSCPTAAGQCIIHKLAATAKTCLVHDPASNSLARKYFLEPMDCYKRYLPISSTVEVAKLPLHMPSLEPIPLPMPLKKRISLDEYRERFIKKFN